MRRPFAALLIGLFLIPADARAQSPANAADIVERSEVRSGPLQQALEREARRMAKASTAQPAPQPQKQRNWAARHPVLLGTMVGAGIGLAWLASEGCNSSDYGCGGLAAFSAGTGALLGAAGGLVVAVVMR
jgi:hypothetical protein